MNNLPAVSFQHPWLLILVPLCALILLAMTRRQRGSLSAYADPALLGWLAPWIGARRRPRMTWIMAASILAAFGAAGPVLIEHDEEHTRRTVDLALVIDISPSMTARDPAPARLQRARMEAHDLIDRLQGERMALVAFSAHAYRVLPLTHDLGLLRAYVDALDPGLTRHRGSNLVQALETAAATLERSSPGARAVIVISDGETDNPAEVHAAARRLAERRIPAFVLGVGSLSGAPIEGPLGYQRDEQGGLHMSRLDRDTLAGLAILSGGRYTEMRADSTDSDHLLTGISRLQASETGKERAPGLPLYAWLLTPALILMLLQSRRYAAPAALVMALVLPLSMLAGAGDAVAAPWDEHQAWKALQAGDYQRAAALYRDVGGYRGQMGTGAAAWHSGDWPAARSSFRAAAALAKDEHERAIAWFNEASAAARMNDITEAVSLLDRVLELYPGHTRAARNRLVLQSLLDGDGSGDAGAAPRTAEFARQTRTAEDALADTRDAPGNTMMEDGAAHGEPSAGLGGATAAAAPDDGGRGAAAMGRFADRRTGTALPSVADDPREVLRHRFMIMDSSRVVLPEAHPW